MISAQVSVYPLTQERFGPAIDRAVQHLRASGLLVESGSMSSVIAGDEADVFAALRAVFAEAAAEGLVVMQVTLSTACPLPADRP